jgi:iron complex transport system ATP-binding protein
MVLPFSIRTEEFVELGRIPHEHPLLGPGEQDRAAVERAIERVGIRALVGRDVRELSLGERQLVLLAMAVAQEARFLVLDEPTVHLDLHHQVRVLELVRTLNGAGAPDGSGAIGVEPATTVLAVLHEIRLAARFFSRIVVLDRGRVSADGAPADVLTDDLIERVFRVDPGFVRPLPVAGA